MVCAKTPYQGEAAVARLLGITRFWNYISDWIECRVHLRPEKDNALDLGSADYRWRTIYTGTAIGARAYNSGNIAISTSAAWTALTFDSERFDTDGIHSTSTNTDRLTCVTPGVYLITGHAQFAANATGARALGIDLNGGSPIAYQRGDNVGASFTTLVSIATIYQLSAGNYVRLLAWQASGGSLDVVAAGNHSPEFAMVRLA